MGVTPRELTIGSGKLTYEDLASLSDEGKRYEILDGDLAVTPSPTTRHQMVSGRLGTLLYNHVREQRLGEVFFAPTDVILDAHTVVEPDILFVATARLEIIQPHAIVGPPDLVIEILSPTTVYRDEGIKAKLCARFGVKHYWLVDPVEQTFETFHLGDAARATGVYVAAGRYAGDAVVPATLFPSLTIDLAQVWQ